MEVIENKKSFKSKVSSQWQRFWATKWPPFLALMALFAIILIVVYIFTSNNGGFLHMNSDDLIQYYPYVSGFFDKIKSGNVSLYDPSLFGGVSFFSAAYYIPLDIFTFVAFLLSFFMENETAYAIMNFMRPVAGALLFYYVIARKYNYKAAFLCALILFCGGTTESYYIFPVYLGICFYAPLAMLIIDLCIEKKGYFYLLLPLYSIVVILYDFYIAYMLLAFACVYFVATMHASLGEASLPFGKRFLEFFKRLFEFLFFIFVGVAMGAFFLMPSALYIMHQTSRNDDATLSEVLYSLFHFNSKKESYWYFNCEGGTIVNFSLRHYFTQWMNLFMPNDPHQLCLVEAGDYVREHATLYMTCGGLLYLVYFFFLEGKYEGRLKFWVALMNILLLIPIFSVIFGFNTVPYLRWFFIPYFLNLYAVAIAMNKTDLGLGESFIAKYAGLVVLMAGLISMVFVFIYSPSIFIHYKNTGDYFYLLLIPSIVFLSACFILLLLSITFKMLGKESFHKKAMPILIFTEFIFASVIIFANASNTTSRYYDAKAVNKERLNNLKEFYNYDVKNGYRTNLYTIFGRETTNLNILEGNVNMGRFFQSFYNTPLNTVLKDIYEEPTASWSRSFNDGYSLITGPIFNTKYVISNENISLPEKYYNLKVDEDNTKYYEVKDDIPFIVYDSFFNETEGLNTFTTQLSILNYGYLTIDEALAQELGITYTPSSLVNKTYTGKYSMTLIRKVDETINGFYVFDLSSLSASFKNYEAFSIIAPVENRRLTHGFMYLMNEKPVCKDDEYDELDYGKLTNYTQNPQLHYGAYYNKDFTDYNYLVVENDSESNKKATIRIIGYNTSIYDNFISEQNNYTNKEFVLDGTKMTIKTTMPDDTKTRIIKTGYTYSDEWVIQKAYDSNNNEIKYQTINIDGGFLGIVVPKGVTDVNISLNFNPEGYQTGCKISIVGSIIYASILIPTGIIIFIKKKKKRVVE